MRADGCGLRRISPCSIPGSRMSYAYGALPVTFSSESARGSDWPTTRCSDGRYSRTWIVWPDAAMIASTIRE